MPLPMWFSGGDQVVDGGNQQRSANDAPLLAAWGRRFQPCGNGRFRRRSALPFPQDCRHRLTTGAAMFSFSLMLEALNSFRVTSSPITVARSLSERPSWHCRARPVCNVRLRRFKAMEKPGSDAAGENAGSAHVHACLADAGSRHVENKGTACGVRLPRFGQRISRRILPCRTAFRIRRAQNGSSEQGCRPVRDASGRSTRFAMRQTRSRRFFRNAGQMLGEALIQAASIGCDMRVGEGGGSIFVWRALQRRYRVIRKDKSRACIQENGSPVWNPRFTRHAHSRCGKAFVQPLRELPKGTFRFGPRGEKRVIRRAGQVFRTSLPSGQGRREENRP